MRCLLCNRDEISSRTEVCPGCGVHLPSLLRDVLPEGTTLHGGKYRIEYALGRGGFGITYLAQHVSLEQQVAVKEFYPQEAVRNGDASHVTVSSMQKGSYERALQRFVREGRVLAMLSHPNVVRVRDQFEERGTAYLVMDYISPARTLREELDSYADKCLPIERVRKITEQLVDALEAVHAKGVYHLDIKPANVLLTPGGHAILVDFGAARQGLGSGKSTQAYTPEYAAPEVLAGAEVGPQTDLYELGVMLHEMLTGHLPPTAIARLTKDRWTTDHLQEPWRGLVWMATRVDRESRPPTVRAWWNAQGASLEPTVVVTPPTQQQQPQHSQQYSQQHPPQQHSQQQYSQQYSQPYPQQQPSPSQGLAATQRVMPPPLSQPGQPSEPQHFAPQPYPPHARKSSTGLIIGVVAAIALIGIGVYAYINSKRDTPTAANANVRYVAANPTPNAQPTMTPPPRTTPTPAITPRVDIDVNPPEEASIRGTWVITFNYNYTRHDVILRMDEYGGMAKVLMTAQNGEQAAVDQTMELDYGSGGELFAVGSDPTLPGTGQPANYAPDTFKFVPAGGGNFRVYARDPTGSYMAVQSVQRVSHDPNYSP